MKFAPTEQQSAIREFVSSSKSSLMVSALAGSAKTTTIKYIAPALRGDVIAVAFNTKIKDALREALPLNFDVTTFNAAGHSAWSRYLSKKLTLDDRKVYKHSEFLGRGDIRVQAMRLASTAKALGLVPDGTPQRPVKIFLPDTPESWRDVITLAQITDLEEEAVDAARSILLASIESAFAGTIDYADQIYMTCCFGANFRQATTVIVDELQDISELNLFMLRRMCLRRAYGFGDEKQAIYAWRGAGTNMMERFRETFSAETLPLTTCFRCSKSVVEEAQEYTPDMVPASWATTGSVSSLGRWSLDTITPGSAVLCRNNAPLFALGFAFLAAGRAITFHGKDMGWQLEKEIRSLSGGNNIFKTVLIERLEEKIAREEESRRERLYEILEVLSAIPGEDTDELSINLTALLNAPEGDVVLSSIHGSKGLEWDKVFFLDRWRIPSKYALTPEALQQEFNLAYVAITRAKHDLVYVNMDKLDKRPGVAG